MESAEKLELGTIIRSHGIKGDLVIYVTTDDLKHFKDLKKIYIENDEYVVTALRFKDKQAVIHVKGIEDRNTSDLQIKKKIYIQSTDLPDPGDDFYFHEIIGFTVHDQTSGDIGTIKDVFEMPQHAVFSINYNGKEALLPASPDFILEIDREHKVIRMNLPEGLLDIYS